MIITSRSPSLSKSPKPDLPALTGVNFWPLFLKRPEPSFMNILEESEETEEGIKNRIAIYNSDFFKEKLDELVKESDKYKDIPLSMAEWDIDDFKLINDRYGHPGGDHVLYHMAERAYTALEKCSKSGSSFPEIVVRAGGDECLIIFPEIKLSR